SGRILGLFRVPEQWIFRGKRRILRAMSDPFPIVDPIARKKELIRERHPDKAHKPDNPVQRTKPDWIRAKAPTSEGYKNTHQIMRNLNLTTVCEEAACPNIGECWTKKHATMMIMG